MALGPRASQEQVHELSAKMGLDLPLVQQYEKFAMGSGAWRSRAVVPHQTAGQRRHRGDVRGDLRNGARHHRDRLRGRRAARRRRRRQQRPRGPTISCGCSPYSARSRRVFCWRCCFRCSRAMCCRCCPPPGGSPRIPASTADITGLMLIDTLLKGDLRGLRRRAATFAAAGARARRRQPPGRSLASPAPP